jgi:Protein of unknown function (DUF3072)
VQQPISCVIRETKSYKIKEGVNFMADKKIQENSDEGNTVKDPDNWTTGDEPMTGAQRSYLSTLSEEAKEEFDENLTKAEASKRIEELQNKTGRGVAN